MASPSENLTVKFTRLLSNISCYCVVNYPTLILFNISINLVSSARYILRGSLQKPNSYRLVSANICSVISNNKYLPGTILDTGGNCILDHQKVRTTILPKLIWFYFNYIFYYKKYILSYTLYTKFLNPNGCYAKST